MLNIVHSITISCAVTDEIQVQTNRQVKLHKKGWHVYRYFFRSTYSSTRCCDSAIDNRSRDSVSFAVSSIYRACRSKWQTISAALFSRIGENPILCTRYFLFYVMFLLVHHDFSFVTFSLLLSFSFSSHLLQYIRQRIKSCITNVGSFKYILRKYLEIFIWQITYKFYIFW